MPDSCESAVLIQKSKNERAGTCSIVANLKSYSQDITTLDVFARAMSNNNEYGSGGALAVHSSFRTSGPQVVSKVFEQRRYGDGGQA